MKQTFSFLLSFFANNKVFFLGLAGALAVVIQQFVGVQSVDWHAVILASGITVLSYIANQWRGQGVTILGILGTLAGVFVQNFSGGKINVSQMILLFIAALLSAVAPPPKPASYETNKVIEQAKQ